MTKKIKCEKCGIQIDYDYDSFHEIEGSHFTYNDGECNISGELPMRYVCKRCFDEMFSVVER